MIKKSCMVAAMVLTLCVGFGTAGFGAAYPSRPLEIIAPANPGGGWDAMARTINRALEIEKLYPQPMAVLNKPGGGGAVGMAYINTKNGNDYELIVYSPPLIINTINKTFSQPYTTLTPLAKLIADYQVFIVKADSPYKTFGDLMDAVKKNPGAVKFAGGSSPGSMDHLAFCKVAKLAGVNAKDLSYVAFSGGGDALTTLLGGNVAFVSTGTGEVLAHIQAGTVRALAITSEKRGTGPLKDVPTLKEAGFNTTYEVWRGVFGPPGMSKEAQTWWAGTIKKMIATKTWKESLEKLQWLDSYSDAAGFAKFLRDEEKSYKELMTDLGFAK